MNIFQNYIDKALIKRLPALCELLQEDQERRSPKVTVHQRPGYREGKLERNLPIKFLPNIEKFEIRPSVKDWLFRLFKVRRKGNPEITMHQWLNGPANKYLNYMFRRLRKQVELQLYDKAVQTMGILMNSTAYQTAAFNKVFHNGHRNGDINDVIKTIRKLHYLVKEGEYKIQYKRVYIPKNIEDPDGPQRPLGVPTPEGRVYLHMYNNLLVVGRQVTEGDSQHGYLPGRGVMTAGMKLFPLLKSEPNIYEADFRQFFDSIPHTAISEALRDMGLPESEVEFIECLNSSIVEPADGGDKMYEPTRDILFDVDGNVNEHCLYNGHSIADYREDYTEEEYLHFLDICGDRLGKDIIKYNGVPQGAPTSCSLSTLVLRRIEKQVKCVIYADDLIIFPRKDQDPEAILSSIPGIELNKAKSRWVKKDGKGVTDSLKFLGFRYIPGKWIDLPERLRGLQDFLGVKPYIPERFIAATRKGATLEFKHGVSFLVFIYNARDLALNIEYFGNKAISSSLTEWIAYQERGGETLKGHINLLFNNKIVVKRPNISFEHTIRRPITGFILSRMAMNKGNLDIRQDFTLRYRTNSWMDSNGPGYSWQNILSRRSITIFTASTYASHDLLRIVSQLNGKSPLIKYIPTNPADRALKRLMGDRRRARKLKKGQPGAVV